MKGIPLFMGTDISLAGVSHDFHRDRCHFSVAVTVAKSKEYPFPELVFVRLAKP